MMQRIHEILDRADDNTKVTLKLLKCSLDNDFISLDEFINITQPDMKEKVYIDRFFHVIANPKLNKWLYVDDDLVKFLGYDSINPSDARADARNAIIRILGDSGEYKIFKHKEFEDIKKNSIWAGAQIETSVKYLTGNKSKHVLISTIGFRKVAMSMIGDKGDRVRNYYLKLEEIIYSYRDCQNLFNAIRVIYMEDKCKAIVAEKDKQLAVELEQKDKQLAIELEQKDKQLAIELEQKDKQLAEEKEKNKQYKADIMKKSEELAICYKTLRPNFSNTKGFIYVSSNKEFFNQSLYKIGFTADIKTRITNSSTSHINEFVILHSRESNNMKLSESYIFKILENYRYIENREFFRFSLYYIIKIVDICASADKDICNKINIVFEEQEKYPDKGKDMLEIEKKKFDITLEADASDKSKIVLLESCIKQYLMKEYKVDNVLTNERNISVSISQICLFVKLNCYGRYANTSLGSISSFRIKPWKELFKYLPKYRNITFTK